MTKFVVFASVVALAGGLRAAWYWPFGSDTGGGDEPRISELMEPASLLIDEAADLAAEGKVDESVANYRKALGELDRIERENPERAKSTEFATLRNKRAYVNAAIDSLLLAQVKENERAVASTDTTELEKKLAAERAAKSGASKPVSLRDQALTAIADGKYERAETLIGKMLEEKPKSAAALNLMAALRARQGKFKEAEEALDQAIQSNPKSVFAYYNMARLLIQMHSDDTSAAKRYYETGRALGGAADSELEALLR